MHDDDLDRSLAPVLGELDHLLDDLGREMAQRMERRRRTRRLTGWALLAGAAGVAGLFMALPPESPTPAAADPGLEVESTRPFAVFETRNPDITVVWLLKGAES